MMQVKAAITKELDLQKAAVKWLGDVFGELMLIEPSLNGVWFGCPGMKAAG
jgi:hypothetical protein